jgi:hypothetical protein
MIDYNAVLLVTWLPACMANRLQASGIKRNL